MKFIFSHLPDSILEERFRDSLSREREELLVQLHCLAEMRRRRLYGSHSTLWAYVTSEFGMEGGVAQSRIDAASQMVLDPSLIPRLESGKLNVTLLQLAAAYFRKEGITDSAGRALVYSWIEGKSTRWAQRELKRRSPEAFTRREAVRWVSGDEVEVKLILTAEQLEQLEAIRGLLAHSHPKAKLDEVLGVIASEYLRRHHPEEKASRKRSLQAPEVKTAFPARL